MRPEAINRRLREATELHSLGVTILKAKRVGKLAEIECNGGGEEGPREVVVGGIRASRMRSR